MAVICITEEVKGEVQSYSHCIDVLIHVERVTLVVTLPKEYPAEKSARMIFYHMLTTMQSIMPDYLECCGLNESEINTFFRLIRNAKGALTDYYYAQLSVEEKEKLTRATESHTLIIRKR